MNYEQQIRTLDQEIRIKTNEWQTENRRLSKAITERKALIAELDLLDKAIKQLMDEGLRLSGKVKILSEIE